MTSWDVLKPAESTKLSLDILCIQSNDNSETIKELHRLVAKAAQICSVRKADGTVANIDCIGVFWSFERLRDKVKKINYLNEYTSEFDCNYLGTCGFDVPTIVTQLQERVIKQNFKPPVAGNGILCADGEDGDSICLLTESKNILLLQNPLRANIQF